MYVLVKQEITSIIRVHPYPTHLSVVSLLNLREKVSLETMILRQISEYGEGNAQEPYPPPCVVNTTRARALRACALHAPVFLVH